MSDDDCGCCSDCYEEGREAGREDTQDDERDAGAAEALEGFDEARDLAHLVLAFVGNFALGEPDAYERLREASRAVLDKTHGAAHAPTAHVGELPW